MTVSADKAAVDADVRGVHGGDSLQLGGRQVALRDTVLVIQPLQHLHLHSVGVVAVAQGTAAQQQVQRLAGNSLAQGLLALLAAQVGQQVGDDQLGLVTLTDAHIHHSAVLLHHHAPQLEGDRDPLVLTHAAVIMGLEIRHTVFLIQRVGLQIQPGGVDMSGGDLHALRQALLPYDRQHQALAAVGGIHLVTGLQRHAPAVRDKALRLGTGDGGADAETLRLALVQKALVVHTVALHLRQVGLGQHIVAVALITQKLLLQGLHFLTHGQFPP